MKRFIGKWWLVAALLLAAALAIFVKPYGIIAVPIIIVFLSMVIPRNTKSTSLVFHNIFLFVILTCIIQVLGIVFWMLKLPLLYDLLVLVLALSVIAIYLVKGRVLNYTSIINKDDIFSGAIAVVAVIVMTIGILHGGGISQQIFRYLASGFDSRQHLSMTMSDYEHHGYILGFDEESSQKIVYTSLGSYPQGWHLVTSMMMSGVSNNLNFTDSPREILAIFFGAILFWYGLVTLLVSRAILYIIRALKNIPNYIAYATALSASILLQVTLLIAVVGHGFANFLPALAYLVVVLIMGVWLHKSATAQSKSAFLVYGSLLIAGTSFSWSLATPIAVLLVATYWLIGFDTGKDITSWVRKNILPIVVSLVVMGLSAVPFIQALTDPYSTVSTHINDDGGIWSISFVFITIIFIVALIATAKLTSAKLRLLLLSTLILPALVYGGVNIYQFYTTGAATYFSTKVLSLAFMLIIVVFGAVLAEHIKAVTGATNKIVLVGLILSVSLLLPPLSGYDMRELRLLNNESKSLSAESSTIINDLFKKKLILSSNLFVFKDNFEEDVITTLLVGSMSRTYPPCTQSFISHKIQNDRVGSLEAMVNCAKDNPDTNYYVISSHANHDELSGVLTDYKNVTIIPSA